jgi:ferredoxin-NADP reductase
MSAALLEDVDTGPDTARFEPDGLGDGRAGAAPTTLVARVQASRWESEGVTSFELARVDGSELPAWAPGAHVDLHLPSGTIRQYSLCGDPMDRTRYRIAVLAQPEGRGGSLEAHRELRPGTQVELGLPRQRFALVDAPRYLFVAGGIGITPLLPMVREAERRGAPWELVYAARTAAHFTFADELLALRGGRVRLVPADLEGKPRVEDLVDGSAGAAVYCCGPAGLMDAMAEHLGRAGRLGDLHCERFAVGSGAPTGAAAQGVSAEGGAVTEAFEVELSASGTVVRVGPDESILEAIRGAGLDRPSSCEMGLCGTCETTVLSGEVDHRDDLLTPEEKSSGCTMMICVSRARCPRLVLDA